MFDYIFAILGLGVLCSSWGIWQLWLEKYHTNTTNLKSGCSTCSHADCHQK
jgi:hypothetical protein